MSEIKRHIGFYESEAEFQAAAHILVVPWVAYVKKTAPEEGYSVIYSDDRSVRHDIPLDVAEGIKKDIVDIRYEMDLMKDEKVLLSETEFETLQKTGEADISVIGPDGLPTGEKRHAIWDPSKYYYTYEEA